MKLLLKNSKRAALKEMAGRNALEVRFEQLKLLYDALPMALAASSINAVLLVVIEWSVIEHHMLIAWLTLVGVMVVSRVYFYWQYRQAPLRIEDTDKWERYFYGGLVASALIWASATLVLFPKDSFAHQVFFVFVIGGMCGGSVTTLSSMRPLSTTYILLCLPPLIFEFMLMGTAMSYTMALMVSLFILVLYNISSNIYFNTLQTILLRFEIKARDNVLEQTLQKQELHAKKTPLGMIEWNTDFEVVDWNPSAEKIFGYSKDEAMGKHAADIIIPDDVKPHVAEIWDQLLKQEGGHHSTNENITKNGNIITCEWNNTPLITSEGEVVGVTSLVQDISDRLAADEQLFHEKERAMVTLQSIADAVMTTDANGLIEFMNSTAEELTGWSNAEAQGKQLDEVFKIIDEDSGKPVDNPLQHCLQDHGYSRQNRNANLIKRDGQIVYIEDSVAPIRNRDGKIIGVVLVFHDVSDERILQQQLSYQASHDHLTGLINRRQFERHLAEALHNATERNIEHVLFYLDLDQFKIINDTCGHTAGDELLRQLSMEVKNQLRTTDILARLGGDEFGVLLINCPMKKAEEIANNMRKAVKNFKFSWMERVFEVGVSIGVVSINNHSGDTAGILSAADMACYTAKDMGRNRIHVYSESDEDMAQRHGEMHYVSLIKKALDEDRLCLLGQVIKPINPELYGEEHYEVLVRMIDEDNKLVLPGYFLPAAERYNLMPAIDRWVVAKVFSDYHIYNCRNDNCRFSINVSGTSLSDEEFLGFIQRELKRYKIPPGNITFEITETAAITHLSKAKEFIDQLQQIGCRFSLDDFGSGLSSFSYLKNLPVDYIKIDGTFVKDLLESSTDRAMVEAITKIGHVMGVRTIAEFVESETIMRELEKIGVDYVQGHEIGMPVAFDELFPSQQEPPYNRTNKQESA